MYKYKIKKFSQALFQVNIKNQKTYALLDAMLYFHFLTSILFTIIYTPPLIYGWVRQRGLKNGDYTK